MAAGAKHGGARIPSRRRCSSFTHPRSDGELAGRLALDAALAHLSRLPRDQAEVILLRVVVGLDADSVGEILGKRPGTVRDLRRSAWAGLLFGELRRHRVHSALLPLN